MQTCTVLSDMRLVISMPMKRFDDRSLRSPIGANTAPAIAMYNIVSGGGFWPKAAYSATTRRSNAFQQGCEAVEDTVPIPNPRNAKPICDDVKSRTTPKITGYVENVMYMMASCRDVLNWDNVDKCSGYSSGPPIRRTRYSKERPLAHATSTLRDETLPVAWNTHLKLGFRQKRDVQKGLIILSFIV